MTFLRFRNNEEKTADYYDYSYASENQDFFRFHIHAIFGVNWPDAS